MSMVAILVIQQDIAPPSSLVMKMKIPGNSGQYHVYLGLSPCATSGPFY